MQDYFYTLADRLFKEITDDQILLLSLNGEHSDFVRLNHARIRQAGSVKQNQLSLTLISQQKQASATLELLCQIDQDLTSAKEQIKQLQQQLEFLPIDPYLNYASEPQSSESITQHALPSTQEALDEIFLHTNKLDLVGIWANGDTYKGFANSLGQKNWHSQNSFNFDWSLFHTHDRAVKCGYAGFYWQQPVLENKFTQAKHALDILKRPIKNIKPGRYRVYLSPAAIRELIDMMAWGGFGLKSHKSQHTPLIKMVSEDWRLAANFSLTENHNNGLPPKFSKHGFAKPAQVKLIEQGQYTSCLVNPRSAIEFNSEVNCDHEHPESLELAPGSLKEKDILATLGTGIYINNLWYCNFSDHNHCRITGMTRFACFWVENGEIVAPINVMRFDDSIYQFFGENLAELTSKQETIFDAGSYEQRSATSYKLPGAIIDNFKLTL